VDVCGSAAISFCCSNSWGVKVLVTFGGTASGANLGPRYRYPSITPRTQIKRLRINTSDFIGLAVYWFGFSSIFFGKFCVLVIMSWMSGVFNFQKGKIKGENYNFSSHFSCYFQ
jgi:hypothetical protein